MAALILAALAVGLDNFGAAIGLGVTRPGGGVRWQMIAVFGIFEAGMPIVGMLIGRAAAHGLANTAPVLGGIVLGLMGAYSVIRALRASESKTTVGTSGLWRLVLVGAVLSIDNLVVGFAIGTYHVNFLLAVVVIGAVSVGLSLIGYEVGSRLGARIGERSELVGGTALIAVGVAIGLGLR